MIFNAAEFINCPLLPPPRPKKWIFSVCPIKISIFVLIKIDFRRIWTDFWMIFFYIKFPKGLRRTFDRHRGGDAQCQRDRGEKNLGKIYWKFLWKFFRLECCPPSWVASQFWAITPQIWSNLWANLWTDTRHVNNENSKKWSFKNFNLGKIETL